VIRVAAIDLGASSGRVLLGTCSAERVELHEVHRFPNEPVRAGGVLRWDILGLYRGILDGLRACVRDADGLDSIGVDGWGVDYGLLDADGQLLANPAHYRDPRTEKAVASVLAAVGPEALYAATGTQLQPFNTLFQLRSEVGTALADAARTALLVPDLIGYWLTGEVGTELTNASTTGLLDPRTLDWSYPLAETTGVPIRLFAPLRRPGEIRGRVRSDVAAEIGAAIGPRVFAVPSHDTAAAVAGVPVETDDFAYVSTGTWALVGLELAGPVITEAARRANFTNEVGADGSIRFLRNITGFWLLQECVRTWQVDGEAADVAVLTAAAGDVAGLRSVIDVQDPAFAAPGDMPARVVAASLALTGTRPETRAEVVRCILDSLAVAVRHAVREAAELAQRSVRVIALVGGGVSNELFCQLVADACGLPVRAGPAEAASWGNVLSQARALGVVPDSLADARRVIARSTSVRTYSPRGSEADWARADRMIETARS
jgi:rhamnulokinase